MMCENLIGFSAYHAVLHLLRNGRSGSSLGKVKKGY